MLLLATRKASLPTKNHVLAVSAKLLLANGYRNTTIKEIAQAAEVSVSSVQNFFVNKEGLLTELTRMMFAGQFGAARQATQQAAVADLPPVYIYAAETAIQLVLTDRNEQLREIYTEAYTMPETLEFIRQRTTVELKAIFGDRFPDYEESDFYEMEVGSAALMRGYMARASDVHFPLHRKIERFLTASLRIYRVGEEEIEQILTFVRSLDINKLADGVMQQLFEQLGHYFESDFSDITPTARSGT